MSKPQSRVTAQGQISVPAEIRRKLGIGPGSVLEWEEKGDVVVVRRAGKYTFEDMHRRFFPNGPPPRRSLKELKQGIEDYSFIPTRLCQAGFKLRMLKEEEVNLETAFMRLTKGMVQ